MPPPSRDDRVKGLKLFNARLNRFGITATLEPGLTLDEIAAYMELWRQGGMTTRVRILQRVFGADDVLNLSQFLAPDFGDDWLRVGGFKYSADGGIEGAALKERYRLVEGEQNDPDCHGKLMTPPAGATNSARCWRMPPRAAGSSRCTMSATPPSLIQSG